MNTQRHYNFHIIYFYLKLIIIALKFIVSLQIVRIYTTCPTTQNINGKIRFQILGSNTPNSESIQLLLLERYLLEKSRTYKLCSFGQVIIFFKQNSSFQHIPPISQNHYHCYNLINEKFNVYKDAPSCLACKNCSL